MGNPFKTPEFKALFKIWNNLLEETGHPEIEDFSREDAPLRTWSNNRRSDFTNAALEARQQYYEMAEALLETFEFKNKLQKKIWALHAAGVSARKIAKMIGRKGPKKTTIHLIIATIGVESGLKRG